MVGKRMKILDAEIENDVLKLKTIQIEGEKPRNILPQKWRIYIIFEAGVIRLS